MKVTKLIVISFLISFLISCKHKLSPKVENIINNISETSYVLADLPEYSSPCEDLEKVATVEDLVYLTNSDNVVVRYYAFCSLRKKNYPKIKEIYYNHEEDFSIINTSNGACLKNSTSINNLMLQALDPDFLNSKFGFTKKQYEKIRENLDRKISEKINNEQN